MTLQFSPQTRRVFHLSLPIFAELLLQLLVGNMDQFMISHFGSAAVAAVTDIGLAVAVVRRLAELLGVRQENVCCVGDHANDIPMLEYAGMAFAPENAIPAVHRVPGIHILPDCRENAMAAMIEILDRRYS